MMLLLLPAAVAALAASAPEDPRPLPVRPAAAVTAPVTWKIDPTHSELTFKIRHLVSKVSGTFGKWSGTIVADPADWKTGSVEVVIETASISTQNERRDNHLRTSEFFEVEKYPTMTFKSTSVTVNGSNIRLAGNLTIKDVTKPVVLEGEYLGTTGEGPGKQRIGFTASTKIDRTQFGVTWNRAAEGGGVTLGDEVTIEITLAAVRQ